MSFFKENNLQACGLPLWVAEYGVSRFNVNTAYIGFQHSETGSVPGDNADLDEFGDRILVGNNSTNVVPYLDSKKELIEKQKEALQQSMGIEQYNRDIATVSQGVQTVE